MLDSSHRTGGNIPQRLWGSAIEWTLIERYMTRMPTGVRQLSATGTADLSASVAARRHHALQRSRAEHDSIVTNADFAYLRNTIDISTRDRV